MSPHLLHMQRVHSRVFYFNEHAGEDLYEEWGQWVLANFTRDVDFRLEDACWPMTPPGIRMVFESEENAQKMVDVWESRIPVTDGIEAPPYTRADPEYRGRGW